MNQRSLRLRLLGGAALWIVLALLIAGLAIGYMFVSNVERATRADLRDSFNRLVASIAPDARAPTLSHPLADPRYQTPLSGLYWQITRMDGPGIARSRSLWDFRLAPDGKALGDGKIHFTTLQGPGNQALYALVRKVRFKPQSGPVIYLVTVAENRAVLDAATSRFGHDLVFALGILGAVLMLAAWLQVRIGLGPLDAIRAGIDAIRHGENDRLPDDYPTEVLPLVGGVNDLLRTQEKSMEFARARAADLAHGLKTPLSVLGTVADDLRERGDRETAELVDNMTREMADRVDYQLRLSRVRMRDSTHVYAAALNRTVTRTISVLEKTREGERLEWSFTAEEALTVDIDQHDLGELLGVLLENAAKWAGSTVSVTIRRTGKAAETHIRDDGPGLTDAQIAQIGSRGKRLDESKKGSGLGLAIAHEIVEINNGTLDFARSAEGGLEVRLVLPLAQT